MSEIDSATIVSAKTGDRLAMQVLLLRSSVTLRPHLKTKIPSRMTSKLSADDVLQQSFVKAVKGMSKLSANDPASFYAWLRTIAERELTDAIRRNDSQKGGGRLRHESIDQTFDSRATLEIQGNDTSPSSCLSAKEAVSRLRRKILGLPPDQREAVELVYCSGMPRQDAARAMSRSDGAMRSLLLRARENLRSLMLRTSLWFD